MDDAICAGDVSRNNLGTIDCNAVRSVDMNRRAASGCRIHDLASDVSGQNLAGQHVQQQDRGQLVLVLGLDEILDSAAGERCKRFV